MKVKPAVFLIRIKNNPVSMWEAGRTYERWTEKGFSVNLVDAYTPETYHNSPYKLNFELKRNKTNVRKFTESEKAVFFSHLAALDIAKRKASPSIIIEHDAKLIGDIPEEILKQRIVPLGHALRDGKQSILPCLAYMITPELAGYFVEDLTLRTITLNIDGYMWEFANSYAGPEHVYDYMLNVQQNEEFREDLGTTIDHGKRDHLPRDQW